jgi:hypothetical protein
VNPIPYGRWTRTNFFYQLMLPSRNQIVYDNVAWLAPFQTCLSRFGKRDAQRMRGNAARAKPEFHLPVATNID